MAMAAGKVLLLRSAEGKVVVAPAWDPRPGAQFLPPVETGVPSRALDWVLHHWTTHNLAAARGCIDGDLWEWDAEFVRRLGDEEGLLEEVHAAARVMRRQCLADLIVAFARSDRSAAARACAGGHSSDVAGAAGATAVQADPAVTSDRAAASRARGRQQAEDKEEGACPHCTRNVAGESATTASTAWSAVGPTPATPPKRAPAAAKTRRIFSSPARSTASTVSTARSKPPSCLAMLL
uniref:Uncharacterized protein n=1 Tax=Arundo donax TaxID=35708 RepID=A0A0A9BS77_ARUDO